MLAGVTSIQFKFLIKMISENTLMFPPIEAYRQGMLEVDAIHTLYWEECGNPDGQAVLFLHGGPGGGTTPGKSKRMS